LAYDQPMRFLAVITLALLVLTGCQTTDYAAELTRIRPLAEQGDAKAQTRLGWLYRYGDGVTGDYAEAFRWYRKAALQGEEVAQYNLGMMYEKGQGVTKDYAEALRWYRLSARQGNGLSRIYLGLLEKKLRAEDNWPPRSRQAKAKPALTPDFGAGLDAYKPKDYATAMRHWRPLAKQGHARAQNRLGVMYQLGQGVTQDYKEAVRWYRKAADQGLVLAQRSLARLEKQLRAGNYIVRGNYVRVRIRPGALRQNTTNYILNDGEIVLGRGPLKILGAVPDNTFWCYEGRHEKEPVKQRETGSPD
jgi:TPR repeat protein